MNRRILWLGFAVFLWHAGSASAELVPFDQSTTESPKPFGYDIFRGQVQEVAEGPVDQDYLVGPRDELLIETWGEYTKRYPVDVSEDGYIDLEAEEKRIFVNGLTLRALQKELELTFQQIHALHFDPKDPKAWVTVKPMRVRKILVYVAGEVVRPGTFSISSTVASLINVLTNAGGINPRGSLRHVTIGRADGKVEKYDLYDFLIRGDTGPVKTRLKYGETIFVALKQKSISIQGEVRRPGVYEVLDEESLRELIAFAGGPAPGAYLKRVQVIRRLINEGTKMLDVDFARLEDEGTTFALLAGDQVLVLPSVDEENIVLIQGKGIYRPNVYEFTAGMTLSDLIEKAEGLRGEAYLEKADLVRTRIDGTKEYFNVSLDKLYRKNAATNTIERIGDELNPSNIPLHRLDNVIVYSYFEIIGRDKNVHLDGHVKEPGEYLLSENLKLSDLLFAYGGFEDRDWRRATYLERADLIRTLPEDLSTTLITFPLGRVLDGDPEADLPLQSMDKVVIFSFDEIEEEEQFARLEGHVKEPGDHLLSENMKLSDLLFAYGGFKDEDFRKTTYLDRADLWRTNRDGSVTVESIDLRKVLDGDAEADFVLQSLDRIVVYEHKDFYPSAYITITGAVREPGRYLLAQNATLSDAIVMAHGLLDEAYKYEAEIIRRSPASVSVDEPAEVFRVPISGNFATEARGKSFGLIKDDLIFIRTVPGWGEPRHVEIKGEVSFPGEFVLAQAEERLSELVKRAGGLKATAFPPAAVFTRRFDGGFLGGERVRIVLDLARALEQPGGGFDLILRDGDSLHVPINPMTVEVRGAVHVQATVQYRPGRGISYYVGLCGGFREDALRRRTLVRNPDGTTTRRGWGWFEPKPLPGSVILVPPYEPVEEAETTAQITREISGWPEGYQFPTVGGGGLTSPTLVAPLWREGPTLLESLGTTVPLGQLLPEPGALVPSDESTTAAKTEAFPPLKLPIP